MVTVKQVSYSDPWSRILFTDVAFLKTIFGFIPQPDKSGAGLTTYLIRGRPLDQTKMA